jgi:hypothetical protein
MLQRHGHVGQVPIGRQVADDAAETDELGAVVEAEAHRVGHRPLQHRTAEAPAPVLVTKKGENALGAEPVTPGRW